jgi:hypothetical protein
MIVAPPRTAPALTPVIRPVAHPVIIAADAYGCGWYRCVLPARAAGAEVREALTVHVDPFTGERLAFGGLGPVNIFQRPAEASLPDTIRTLRAGGREVWIELDDDISALDARNPMGSPGRRRSGNVWWRPSERRRA